MYARAVWKEGDIEEEGVVPENWIDRTKKILRWPRMSSTKTEKAIKDKMNPKDDWMTFPLIKIKFTSGKYCFRSIENYLHVQVKIYFKFEMYLSFEFQLFCFQMFIGNVRTIT